MKTFIFQDFYVWPTLGDDESEPATLNAHINMKKDLYPIWVVDSVELRNDSAMPVLTMSETQFSTIFPDGKDIINNALEWVHGS